MKIKNKIRGIDVTFRIWLVLIVFTMGFYRAAFSQNQNIFTVIPGPAEGNSFSTMPFSGPDSARFQQVYNAAAFNIYGDDRPLLIRQLYLRLDTAIGLSTGGFSTDFPAFQLDLSTTTRAVDGLSANFSENVGGDDRVVIPSGPIRLGASGVNGQEPQTFSLFITLPTPFYYDPARGNLLMDIRNFGGGRTSIGDPPFFGLAYVDAENVTGDSVSRVYANSVNAASGNADSLGLVTAFVMTPVPEPSSLALMAVGLGVIALLWKTKKKGKHVTPIADKSFSYAMKPGPDPEPTKSPTGEAEYAAHWDIRRFDLENNLYDLYATDNNSVSPLTGIPRGVNMFGLAAADIPPYIFPVFIFRENVVRHIDHLPGAATQDTFGIYATTIGSAIIEENVIDANDPRPLSYFDSGNLTHLQNHSTSGALIHGYNGSANKTVDDLESRIQDALTMAL